MSSKTSLLVKAEQVEPADETTVPLNPNGAHVGNGRGHNTKVASADTNGKAGSNGQATPSQQPKISYGGVFKVSSLQKEPKKFENTIKVSF